MEVDERFGVRGEDGRWKVCMHMLLPECVLFEFLHYMFR